MKILIRFILLCQLVIYPFQMFTQVGVTADYHIRYDEFGANLIHSDNGSFILHGRSSCEGSRLNCPILVKVDSLGTSVWKKVINHHNPESITYSSIKEIADGFIMLGSVSNGEDEGDAIISRFDYQGELVWEQILEGQLWDNAYDMLQDINGDLLITVTGGQFGLSGRLYLVKLDESGELLDDIRIDHPYRVYNGGAISITQDNNLLILVNNDTTSNAIDVFPSVIKCDTMGVVLWRKDLPITSASVTCTSSPQIVLLENGGFVVPGCVGVDYEPPNFNIYPILYFYDPQGELEYEISFQSLDFSEIGQVMLSSDGNLLGCGIKDTRSFVHPAWIFKMSDVGELIWERRYSFPDSQVSKTQFRLSGIIENPNASISCIGTLRDISMEHRYDIWFLQVDEEGCFHSNCKDIEIEISR